jgi:hypothetical protein
VLFAKRQESETSFTVIFIGLGQKDFRTKGRGGFPACPFAVREVTPYFKDSFSRRTPFRNSFECPIKTGGEYHTLRQRMNLKDLETR